MEHYELKKVESESSFDEIMQMLDKAFQYDNIVQLPQDFENFFTHLSRKPGSTLLQYVTDFDEKLRRLEVHDVKLPDAVQGWFMLKKANLTKEQRQLITTQAPSLERLKVQEALYLVLGQDYKAAVVTDKKPFFKKTGRGYVAEDEFPEDDYAEYGHWGDEDYDDSWQEEDSFDQEAVYYNQSEAEWFEEEPDEAYAAVEEGSFDVDSYDTAYASYMDARRRFQDLKLSRGYLPIVALTDQQQSGSQPPSPSRKGKGGKGKGKSSTTVHYSKKGGKADPRGRAQAAMQSQCLRCGGFGHQAAQCPKPAAKAKPSSSTTTSTKRPHTEGMAAHLFPEHGNVIFEDAEGNQRVDCVMLDPGASALLMGSGPLQRYVAHLQDMGYPVETIEMISIERKFHFGGNHSAVSHWLAKLPVFVNYSFGFVSGFVLKGETPMLLGRPVMEALGIVLDFQNKMLMFHGSDWEHVLLGRHGEYLLSLTEQLDLQLLDHQSFDLTLAGRPRPPRGKRALDREL